MTSVSDTSPQTAARPDRTGLYALLGGTGIIAWSAIFVRFADVGPLSSAAWRLVLALPILWAWTRRLAAKRQAEAEAGSGGVAPSAASGSTTAMVIGVVAAGIAFAADVAVFHLSLGKTDVANASFIANIAPILVVIGGALFYREHPPAKIWFCFALALGGSWTMAGLVAPADLGAGDLFAVAAAISYASYLLIMKRVRLRLDGPAATLWTAIVSAAILLVAALGSGETFVPQTGKGWAAVLLLGIVSHAVGQGLTSIAIGRVPVGVVALVILAWAPASAFLGWAVLGETLSHLQIVGAAIILSALFLARPR